MATTEQRLADALRALYTLVPFDGNHADEMAKGKQLKEAREALAAYDAQQAQPVAAGAWSANAGSVWDHTGKWVADCNREHAARIVQCVNAHDGLVSALQACQRVLDDNGGTTPQQWIDAEAAAREALAQAGVNHA